MSELTPEELAHAEQEQCDMCGGRGLDGQVPFPPYPECWKCNGTGKRILAAHDYWRERAEVAEARIAKAMEIDFILPSKDDGDLTKMMFAGMNKMRDEFRAVMEGK